MGTPLVMVPLEVIWKSLWLMFDPLPDDSPHPGIPKGVVLTRVLSQPGVGAQNEISKQIAQIWINRCLPHLFSPQSPEKDFSDAGKGTFKLEFVPLEERDGKRSNIPTIPPDFKEVLKKELLEEISNRRSAAQLAGLRKRTDTEPNIRTVPPKKRARMSAIDRSASALPLAQQSVPVEDLTNTPEEGGGVPRPQLPQISDPSSPSDNTGKTPPESPRAKRKKAQPKRAPKKSKPSTPPLSESTEEQSRDSEISFTTTSSPRPTLTKSQSIPSAQMIAESEKLRSTLPTLITQEQAARNLTSSTSSLDDNTKSNGTGDTSPGLPNIPLRRSLAPSTQSLHLGADMVVELRTQVSQLKILVSSLVGEVEASRIQAQKKERFIENEFSNFRAELSLLKIQIASLSRQPAPALARSPSVSKIDRSELKRTQSSPAGALKPPSIPSIRRTPSGQAINPS